MRHRKYRRNAWSGHPLLHKWAAKKGHRKSRRRTRRNAGTASIIRETRSTVMKGVRIVPQAGAILAGNIGATWGVEQLGHYFPIFKTSKYVEVISLFGLGALNGMLTAKIKPIAKYSNATYIGGMLAGVTRSLKYIFPNTFQTCGIGDVEHLEGMDGMDDWFASAGPDGNIAHARNFERGHNPAARRIMATHSRHHAMAHRMHGMDAYAHLNQGVISGLGAYAGPAGMQAGENIGVHGMGDAIGEVHNEIAGMA